MSTPPGEDSDAPATAYLVLTLRLSEEAANLPLIDVIRAVRTSAVALAAARGEAPELSEVELDARRRLGLTA